MQFSISQAAKNWHISRTTIYKKISTGELSQNPDKTIELVEMVRVFWEPKTKSTNVQNKAVEQDWTNDFFNLKIELEKEKTKSEQLEKQLNEYKERVQHLELALNNSLNSISELSKVRLFEQPKRKKIFGIF